MIARSVSLFLYTCTLLFSSALWAVPASSDQIDRLMEADHSREILGNVSTYVIQTVMKEVPQQLAQAIGATTPQQQTELEAITINLAASLAKTLAWERMQPLYRQLYARELQADDATVLLYFYRSAGGQLLLDKLSEVSRNPDLLQNQDALTDQIVRELAANPQVALEFERFESEHQVTRKYMQLFLASIEVMKTQIEPVIQEQLTRDLMEWMSRQRGG